MGPGCKRFWLPLTRLGAFFVAVVVTGNVVLHALRPAAADFTSSSDVSEDYFARKKKRLERQFQRTMEKFLGAPAVVPVKEKMGSLPTIAPTPPLLCVVPAVEPVAIVPTPVAVVVASPAPAPPPASPPPPPSPALGFLAPEPAPFIWPEPLPAPPSRGLDLPSSVSMMEEFAFRADLVTELYRRNAHDPAADIGDSILRAPEVLIDSIFTCANGMGSRPAVRAWEDDDQRSMVSRILDVQIGPRKDRIWAEFMRQFADREARYLGNFGDSRVNTWGFENRTEDADLHELLLDQRKVFWDALRRTYVSRYKIQADERIREEAWYVDRWSGADYAILPPLLGAYVFYRGLEKRFSISGTKLLLSVEPVSEWYRPHKHNLPAAVALEWTMKDCPLGVIVSAGLHDGRYGLDFIGIGTSLGAVRQALIMQEIVRPQ